LRLVYDPKPGVTATSPSFRFEIRSAYRIGGTEIDRESVMLALSVNRRERSPGGETYLALLGFGPGERPKQVRPVQPSVPARARPQRGRTGADFFASFRT